MLLEAAWQHELGQQAVQRTLVCFKETSWPCGAIHTRLHDRISERCDPGACLSNLCCSSSAQLSGTHRVRSSMLTCAAALACNGISCSERTAASALSSLESQTLDRSQELLQSSSCGERHSMDCVAQSNNQLTGRQALRKEDKAPFLTSQSSEQKQFLLRQDSRQGRMAGTHSAQASRSFDPIPDCTAVSMMLDKSWMESLLLLFQKAALPGEHHICCQISFLKLLVAKRTPPVPFCASSGVLRRITPTLRPT